MKTHATHVEHLPHMGLWKPYCNQCGSIGTGERYEQDAYARAERHQEAVRRDFLAGLER